MKKRIIFIIIFVAFFAGYSKSEILIFGSFGHTVSLTSTFYDTKIINFPLYQETIENNLGFNPEIGFKLKFSKNGFLNISGGYFTITEKYKRTFSLMGKTYSNSSYKSFSDYYLRIFPEYRWANYSIYIGAGFNYFKKDEKDFKINNLDTSIHIGTKYLIKPSRDLNVALGIDGGYYFFYNNFLAFTFSIGVEKKVF